jgi:hypothetical protein
VPVGAEPLDSRMVQATTRNGRQILDESYQPVIFTGEDYLTDDDELVTFQDHHTGHEYGAPGGGGDQPPHLHVRAFDESRNGYLPGTQEHYPYDPNLG